MDGQKSFRTQSSYSEEFKLKVLQEVLSGQLTKAQANKKYDIKSLNIFYSIEFSIIIQIYYR